MRGPGKPQIMGASGGELCAVCLQDDELEVQLDDVAAEGLGGPPGSAPKQQGQQQQQSGGFRYARSGAPPPRSDGAPRPYMDASSSGAQPTPAWGGPGGGRGAHGGGRGLGTRPWRPQFVPLSECSACR